MNTLRKIKPCLFIKPIDWINKIPNLVLCVAKEQAGLGIA